jgi:RNA polymerase sigma factor (sigma-70 family)
MAIAKKALQQLRQLALTARSEELTDADLLQQFVRQRDELAFETLVHRHGALVLGVCRRLLRNRHDAEDAFQATFLVLARQAGSIRKPAALASWLHGVAQRTALTLRRATRRRRVKETQAMPRTVESTADTAELYEVLDHELAALPEKYRLAILLCDLEGMLHKQAARELGCAEGTLASRLVRGRRLLAARLTQRGLMFSGATLATLLASEAVPAGVPAPLLTTVTALAMGRAIASRSVTTLTQGVLKMMLVNKLRAATALLLVLGALTAATGAFVLGQDRAQPEARKSTPPKLPKEAPAEAGLSDAEFIRKVCLDVRGSLPTDIEVHYFLQDRNQQKRTWLVDMLQQEAARMGKKQAAKPQDEADFPLSFPPGLAVRQQTEKDLARLQGEWEVIEFYSKGRFIPASGARSGFQLVFQSNRMTLRVPNQPVREYVFQLEVDQVPKLIRLIPQEVPASQTVKTVQWAYDWKGDRLRIALKGKGETQPADLFQTPLDAEVQLMELKLVRFNFEPRAEDKRGGVPSYNSNSRTVKIPFQIDQPRRASITGLKVFVFEDHHRSVIRMQPNDKEFTFIAPHDGVYRFVVQLQHEDGRVEPADPRNARTDLQVCVHTSSD